MHSIRKKHKKGPDFYPILSSGRPTENHPHFRPPIPDTLDWQHLKKSTNNHKHQPSDQTDDERKQDGKCELKTQNSEYFHEHITFPTAWHHPAPPFVKTTTKIFRSINQPSLLQDDINKHQAIKARRFLQKMPLRTAVSDSGRAPVSWTASLTPRLWKLRASSAKSSTMDQWLDRLKIPSWRNAPLLSVYSAQINHEADAAIGWNHHGFRHRFRIVRHVIVFEQKVFARFHHDYALPVKCTVFGNAAA